MTERFDEFYDSDELSFGDAPTKEVEEHLQDLGGSGLALDMGAGDGRNSLYLAEKGFDVIALDSSKTGIEKLKRIAAERGLGDRLKTVHGDARTWEYPERKFDLIFAITLFDHLETGDIGKLFYKVRKSLKRGGYIFIKVHTIEDPGYKGDDENASELSSEIKHYFRPNELLKHLKGNFHIKKYEERTEHDTTHGEPHKHGFARVVARKMK